MKAAILLMYAPLLLLHPEGGHKKIIRSNAAPQPIGPYSQAVEMDGTLYISGNIGLTIEGKMDTVVFEGECHRVLENLTAILEAGGKSRYSVCKTTVYLTDLHLYKRFNDVYEQYFRSDPPAREVVQVSSLPRGAHVEISAVAR